jgi:hypothetical protein
MLKMTHTTTAGLPQMLAFIVTIFAILVCGIYALTIANKDGKLRASQIAKVIGIFGFILFSTWAVEGYANGQSVLESGLRPFGLVLRFLPFLLKAL